MAVWSEIKHQELGKNYRLEPEYYQPFYLEAYSKIKHCGLPISKLGSLCKKVTDGSHITPDYQEEGIPFLMIRNVHEENISFEDTKFITEKLDLQLKHCKPKVGDILLSKVGSIGISAVVQNDAPDFNIFVSLAVIKDIEINPYYLSTFLNSYYGKVQCFREAKGISQPDLHLEEIRDFLVPLPDDSFQREIQAIVLKSIKERQKSKKLYQEAEALLLHELGLDALDLSDELTYERNFDEVAQAGRLDAQYFAPRYQRTLKQMSKSGKTIGDVAPLAKRLFRSKLADEYFEYIEIGSLTGDGRAESEKLLSAEAPSRAQWIVRKDDVITSTVRPIRRLSALIESQQENFVCSSGFAVLEPEAIEPEVLLVWLRLPIISEILDLHTTATMYPAIAVDTLLRIPITKPSESVSKQIVQNIQNSREAIKTAKQLLEDAKRRVEDMILGE